MNTIETTEGGGNGYPRRLKVAHTADTMRELREHRDAELSAGNEVEIVRLHRRDGWALWERVGYCSLHDDAYMGTSDNEWTTEVTKDSDCVEVAYMAVCGERYEVQDAADLIAKAKAVKELADDLPDPDDLEEGERVLVFLDGWSINYTVKTGQNGYNYDTHQYCTGLIVTERDEEEGSDD